ncbi:hypothetical protein Tco_1402137 [Tanacetum coccineum]
MDMYHSRLTQDDLNDLIVKYKIPRDLYPRLPFEEFVMSELLDDAIGICHRMFDFSGVRIPFSLFLLALIKHYRVHFSQLGPLGLNKGDWFSFAKRRAPSPVCIDDNRSCMKHWKSGFFLIDRMAIPDSMVWRHPIAVIDTDFSGDAIHTNFFPFSTGLYYATYPEGGVAGNCEFTREVWDAPYQPTFEVLTKEVFKDPAVFKIVVELVSSLNDKLSSSDGSFAKSKGEGKERKKKIKSLTRGLDNLHAEVARLFYLLESATVLEAEKDEEILHLKATPSEFSSFFRGQF